MCYLLALDFLAIFPAICLCVLGQRIYVVFRRRRAAVLYEATRRRSIYVPASASASPLITATATRLPTAVHAFGTPEAAEVYATATVVVTSSSV